MEGPIYMSDVHMVNLLIFFGSFISWVAVALAVICWWTSLRSLPPGPWGLPIVGYLPWIDPKKPQNTMKELTRRYGKIFSMSMGSLFTVVVTDPQLIREALSRGVFSDRANLSLTHGIMHGNDEGFGLFIPEYVDYSKKARSLGPFSMFPEQGDRVPVTFFDVPGRQGPWGQGTVTMKVPMWMNKGHLNARIVAWSGEPFWHSTREFEIPGHMTRRHPRRANQGTPLNPRCAQPLDQLASRSMDAKHNRPALNATHLDATSQPDQGGARNTINPKSIAMSQPTTHKSTFDQMDPEQQLRREEELLGERGVEGEFMDTEEVSGLRTDLLTPAVEPVSETPVEVAARNKLAEVERTMSLMQTALAQIAGVLGTTETRSRPPPASTSVHLTESQKMSLATKVQFQKLEAPLTYESDFENWKARLMTELESQNCAFLIEEGADVPPEFSVSGVAMLKRKVVAFIAKSVADDLYALVRNEKEPRMMIKRLEATCQPKSRHYKYGLTYKLHTMRFDPQAETPTAFVARFNSLVRQLSAYDVVSSADRVYNFLFAIKDTVPELFSAEIDKEEPTAIHELQDRLVDIGRRREEELRRSSASGSAAHWERGRQSGGRAKPDSRSKGQSGGKSDEAFGGKPKDRRVRSGRVSKATQCYRCNGRGHLAADCTINGWYCYECREITDHKSRECPRKQKRVGTGRSSNKERGQGKKNSNSGRSQKGERGPVASTSRQDPPPRPTMSKMPLSKAKKLRERQGWGAFQICGDDTDYQDPHRDVWVVGTTDALFTQTRSSSTTSAKDSTEAHLGATDGIIAAEGSKWLEQRRFLKTFLRNVGMTRVRNSKREQMEHKILTGVAEVCERLLKSEGQPVDPLNVLMHTMGNIMNQLIFGISYPEGDAEWEYLQELAVEGVKHIGVAGPLNFLPFLRFLPTYQKTITYILRGQKITHDVYKSISDAQDMKVEQENLMYAFKKEMSLGNGKYFSEEQMYYLAADMFGAGVETSLTTLRWFLVYMAVFPDVQKEVYQELEDVMGNRRMPILDDIPNVNFMEACMMESQRKRPVVPLGIPHGTREETELGGYRIPQGTMILVPLAVLNTDPDVWEDPDSFNPNRFLDAEGKVVREHSHFMPFQCGKRVCIGEEMARMMLFLFGAGLLRNFSFSLPADSDLPLILEGHNGITWAPGDHRLIFTRRD